MSDDKYKLYCDSIDKLEREKVVLEQMVSNKSISKSYYKKRIAEIYNETKNLRN